MDQQRPKGKRFCVIKTGQCEEADQELTKKLNKAGQVEVFPEDECDYYVAFCPVTSRVLTDIGEAEKRIPGDKPAILVVMHHTHNSETVIVDSDQHTTKPNIKLTVDYLFYKGHPLTCKHNDIAWHAIKKFLGVTEPDPRRNSFHDWCCKLAVLAAVAAVGIGLLTTLVLLVVYKK